MSFAGYTTVTPDTILDKFNTSLTDGLSRTQVEKQRRTFGQNRIVERRSSAWRILLRQWTSPFIYLLGGASLLSWILGEGTDALMILLFIIINTAVGFHQEYRSEKTAELLKKFTVSRARVRREGKENVIDSTELVPGDIVSIEVGDIIPADVRIVADEGLIVDESALTGESVPIEKSEGVLDKEITEPYQAKNIGFSGTTVVGGKGIGVVIAIGRDSFIGDVSRLTTQTKRISNFEKNISTLSAFLLRLIAGTLVLVVGINLVLKRGTVHAIELIVFAIALAVSVIPEALPVVTTFSLSRGALRLAKKHVVVKRLSAVEDLGSITVLCSDKTGTITENTLTVKNVFVENSEDPRSTLTSAAIASPFLREKKKEPNNSFDMAIWAALTPEERRDIASYTQVDEIPFSPERRRNTVLTKRGKDNWLVVRGAEDSILPLCPHVDSKKLQALAVWAKKEGSLGRRVIVVAHKRLHGDVPTISTVEQGLTFIGAVSFEDPIKESAKASIEKAKRMGVRVKILTGDSADVAASVAINIGLISSQEDVLTGDAFEKLSEESKKVAAQSTAVFARVSPQQKYHIIELLQKNEVVGFLGEGINDAPSLKIAHVGIVVAGASDIAREAADIVLLKHSLRVIVDGIEEGRKEFANTIKYIKATLASNLGNFYALAISTFLIDYLPMLPIHLLLVNLLSDFPMIAIAADSVDKDETAQPRSYDMRDIALFAVIIGSVSTIFDLLFFGIFSRVSPGALHTYWFIGSILTELVFIFSVRTRLPFFRGSFPSPILTGLSGLAFVATILIPATPLGQRLFQFTPPTTSYLLLVLGIVAIYFITTECAKLFYYRFSNGNKKEHKNMLTV